MKGEICNLIEDNFNNQLNHINYLIIHEYDYQKLCLEVSDYPFYDMSLDFLRWRCKVIIQTKNILFKNNPQFI